MSQQNIKDDSLEESQQMNKENPKKADKKGAKKEAPKKKQNQEKPKKKEQKEKKEKGNTNAQKNQSSEKDYQFLIEYIKQANKPFNVTTIESNIKAKTQFKKATLESALAQAVQENLLRKKLYGATVVFWFNQSQLEDVKKEEISDLTQQIIDQNTKYSEISQQLRTLNQQLTKILMEKTDYQLISEIERYNKEIEQQEEKLNFYKSEQFISVEESKVNAVQDKLQKVESTYKKRKRICEDGVKEIIENNEDQIKTLQEMFETIGLDQE